MEEQLPVSSTPPMAQAGDGDGGLSIVAIVGIAAGGVAVLFTAGLVAVAVKARRRLRAILVRGAAEAAAAEGQAGYDKYVAPVGVVPAQAPPTTF